MKPDIRNRSHLLGKTLRLLGLSCCVMMTSIVSAEPTLDQVLPPFVP